MARKRTTALARTDKKVVNEKKEHRWGPRNPHIPVLLLLLLLQTEHHRPEGGIGIKQEEAREKEGKKQVTARTRIMRGTHVVWVHTEKERERETTGAR